MRFHLSTMADITLDTSGERAQVSYAGNLTAETAKEFGLGLELAEFCISENLDAPEATTEQLLRPKLALAPEAVLHGPYNELYPAAIDSRAAQLAALRCGQALTWLQRLGLRKLVIHGGYVPTVYYKDWFCDRSAEFWGEFLAAHPGEYELCLENVMEDDPGMLRDIVERVNDPRLRLCLDIGHANVTPVPVEAWLESCLPYLSHLHLHNNSGQRDTHNLPGEGSMDAAALLRRALTLCPELTVTAEVMEPRRAAEWLRDNGFLEA